MNELLRRLLLVVGGTAVSLFAIIYLSSTLNTTHADFEADEFGYGVSMAELEIAQVQAMGFNWIRVFDPPGVRHPVKVLYRVDIHASHLNDIEAFGDEMETLAQGQAAYIDAYELGNEVNLDASYGWAAPPNAAHYATLLCEAYGRIKTADPDAIVVSAGLAPVGRVVGNWNGHGGHNGLFQDEREYMKEFLNAGGGNCFDAFGYHPFGYSADFDAAPDVWSADPTQNCSNGFCFRGLEKIYEILQSRGLGHKQIWATEYGWLTLPPDSCTNDGSWNGRFWQIVTHEKQASNLLGSFLYAREHYPWMGAMFVFNYNFNTASWYDECEQMRFYSIKGRPAQETLAAMPKISNPQVGFLRVQPDSFTKILLSHEQPFAQNVPIVIENWGNWRRDYEIVVEGNTAVDITLNGPVSGSITGLVGIVPSMDIVLPVSPVGTYSNTVRVSSIIPTLGITEAYEIPINIFVWEEINHVYLPIVVKQ